MALATHPKSTAHGRKRQAGHHRHSQRYLKSYWPYLPMLLIIGMGLVVNHVWTNQAVLGAQAGYDTQGLLAATNTQRLQNGELPLLLNTQLTAAAQAKANDMVQHNYWSHNSLNGQTPWSFIAASGYQYQSAGENLAYGFANADSNVQAWMNSPEHRANLLNVAYKEVGFGIAASPDYQNHGPQTVVVAEYAQPATGAAEQVLGSHTDTPSHPVARLQTLSTNLPFWSLAAVIVITAAAMAIFVARHGYRLHRLLNRGERFVVHHPLVDIIVVLLITIGCVLTRTSGFIR